MDEITINLRALTEQDRLDIEQILNQSLNIIEDETNAEALEILQNFRE